MSSNILKIISIALTISGLYQFYYVREFEPGVVDLLTGIWLFMVAEDIE